MDNAQFVGAVLRSGEVPGAEIRHRKKVNTGDIFRATCQFKRQLSISSAKNNTF